MIGDQRVPPRFRDDSGEPLPGWRELKTILAATVFSMGALLLVVAPALVGPADAQGHEDPSPLGFTIGLLLYFVPFAVAWTWGMVDKEFAEHRRPLNQALLIIGSIAVILDLGFLGASCFTFPNTNSVLNCCWLPAIDLVAPYSFRVPVEDVLFYVLATGLTLVIYAWGNLTWQKTNSEDYVPKLDTADVARLVRLGRVERCWHHDHISEEPFPGVVRGLLTLVKRSWREKVSRISTCLFFGAAGAVAVGGMFLGGEGTFPLYAVWLLLGAGISSSIMLGACIDHVNWRSFAATALYMTLLSVLFEITVALPYGWWGFEDQILLGVRFTAWWDLPVEQLFLYVINTYEIVLVYETVVLWRAWRERGRGKAFHEDLVRRTAHLVRPEIAS